MRSTGRKRRWCACLAACLVLFLGTSGCSYGPVPMDVVKGDFVYPGLTPLMQAAAQGDVKAVEEALKNNAQVNARNYDDNLMTALHYAVLKNSEEIVRMLLAAGADPDPYINDFRTPLHLAASRGSTGIVEDLIGSGCGIDAQDLSQNNALYYAVRNSHPDCAQALLDSGAKINPRNDSAEDSLVTAESYLAAARSYRSKGLNERSRESYRAASDYYRTATRQYEQLITDHNLRVAGQFLLYAVATGTSAVLAQKQAQMQAQQMAEISALKSPTGVGVGYGYASYPVAVSPGFGSSYRDILDARLGYCKKLAEECSATAESF